MRFVEPLKDPQKIAELEQVLYQFAPKYGLYFVLGINTALRVSDLIKLKVSDVLGSHIELSEQKTKKRKKILIPDHVRAKILSFIQGKKEDDWLFEAKHTGRHIKRKTASKFLVKASRQIGLKNINTHSLRKTFGYHLYKETNDLALVMKFLNHSNIANTLRYLGIDQEKEDQTMKNFNLGLNNENKN